MLETSSNLDRSLLKSSLNLFLQYPVIGLNSQKQFDNFLIKSDQEFQGLLDQTKDASFFSRFFYESGLNRPQTLDQKVIDKTRQINKDFNEFSRPPVEILTRRSLLRIASSEILNNKNTAFINFDLKDLRLADRAGYGDILLSDFARILKEVSSRYRGLDKYDFMNLIPTRVGGDEFCIFASSKQDIDEAVLVKIYQEVQKELAGIKAYYKSAIKDDEIEEKSPLLKQEGTINDQIIIANIEEDRKMFLSRAIIKGRVPSKDQFKGENKVRNDEYMKAKATAVRKFLLELNLDKNTLNKRVMSIVKSHPEYHQEMTLLIDYLKKGNINIANYLFSVVNDYLKDPLIDEYVHTFPDLMHHLEHRIPKPGEKLIYYYVPWLKVLNSDIGYNKTDGVIKKVYENIIADLEAKGYERNNILVARKGGDFIFLINEYKTGNSKLDCQEFFPEGHIFNKGMDVFTSTIDYPKKGDNLKDSMDNVEKIARASFVSWLDNLYKKDPEKAKDYIGYYIKERKADRLGQLFDWLNDFKNPSRSLIDYLLELSASK